MHRFRKKSEANTRLVHLQGPQPRNPPPPVASSSHPAPFPSASTHAVDTPPSLPPNSNFRTSLILPDLRFRFRQRDQERAEIDDRADDLLPKLAASGSKTPSNAVPDEEVNLAVGPLQAHAGGVKFDSYLHAGPSTPNRYRNDLFGSGQLKDQDYMRPPQRSASRRTAGGNDPIQQGEYNFIDDREDADISFLSSASSKSNEGPEVDPEPTIVWDKWSVVAAEPSVSSDNTPTSGPKASQLALDTRWTYGKVRHTLLSLEEAIRDFERDAGEDLIPRTPSAKLGSGFSSGSTGRKGDAGPKRALTSVPATTIFSASRKPHKEEDLETLDVRQQKNTDRLWGLQEQIKNEAVSSPTLQRHSKPNTGGSNSALPRPSSLRKPSTNSRIPGYIPGMPRPIIPRDVEPEDSQGALSHALASHAPRMDRTISSYIPHIARSLTSQDVIPGEPSFPLQPCTPPSPREPSLGSPVVSDHQPGFKSSIATITTAANGSEHQEASSGVKARSQVLLAPISGKSPALNNSIPLTAEALSQHETSMGTSGSFADVQSAVSSYAAFLSSTSSSSSVSSSVSPSPSIQAISTLIEFPSLGQTQAKPSGQSGLNSSSSRPDASLTGIHSESYSPRPPLWSSAIRGESAPFSPYYSELSPFPGISKLQEQRRQKHKRMIASSEPSTETQARSMAASLSNSEGVRKRRNSNIRWCLPPSNHPNYASPSTASPVISGRIDAPQIEGAESENDTSSRKNAPSIYNWTTGDVPRYGQQTLTMPQTGEQKSGDSFSPETPPAASGPSSVLHQKVHFVQQTDMASPLGNLGIDANVGTRNESLKSLDKTAENATSDDHWTGKDKQDEQILEKAPLSETGSQTDTVRSEAYLEILRRFQGISWPNSVASKNYDKLDLSAVVTYDPWPTARGHFSDVHKGKLNDKMVAVKILRLPSYNAYNKKFYEKTFVRFFREMTFWSELNHVNIVQMMGFIASKGVIGLVSHWHVDGNLVDHLAASPDISAPDLMLDVAEGTHYLHDTAHVVHGDLKGMNILIDEHGIACLVDFGVSQQMDDVNRQTGFTTTGSANGTTHWMAPEVVEGDRPSYASDIYSCAGVFLEICSKKYPFHYLSRGGDVIKQKLRGVLPHRSEYPELNDKDSWWDLFTLCWDADASKRPTIGVIVRNLYGDCGLGPRASNFIARRPLNALNTHEH